MRGSHIPLFFVSLLIACGQSTDDICDAACSEWKTCTQVDGNRVNYSYDECYAECEDEGDWTRGYVKCLESYDTCPELGNQCG